MSSIIDGGILESFNYFSPNIFELRKFNIHLDMALLAGAPVRRFSAVTALQRFWEDLQRGQSFLY